MRFVPMAEWGKDHWSLLAYVETCCVDGDGTLDRDRMRTNHRRHPGLVGPRIVSSGLLRDRPFKHPTRLREGVELDHDDWNCFYDLEEARLVLDDGTGIYPHATMSPRGIQLAAELRSHKMGGGTFATFDPRAAGSSTAGQQDGPS